MSALHNARHSRDLVAASSCNSHACHDMLIVSGWEFGLMHSYSCCKGPLFFVRNILLTAIDSNDAGVLIRNFKLTSIL